MRLELGYERMLLAPLDRAGIIEAIEGPTRDPDLRRQYGLTIEPGLADRIAGELEHDAGSALAPTLQVLLTKLWESAGGKGASFTGDLYDRLRDQGFLLKDVLDEGLKALAAWRPELVDSGFALDLLEHHTTSMDTAETRTRADLLARYPHRADVLDRVPADPSEVVSAHPRRDAVGRRRRRDPGRSTPTRGGRDPAGARHAGPPGPRDVPDLRRPRSARPSSAGEPRPGVAGRRDRPRPGYHRPARRRGGPVGDAGLDHGRDPPRRGQPPRGRRAEGPGAGAGTTGPSLPSAGRRDARVLALAGTMVVLAFRAIVEQTKADKARNEAIAYLGHNLDTLDKLFNQISEIDPVDVPGMVRTRERLVSDGQRGFQGAARSIPGRRQYGFWPRWLAASVGHGKSLPQPGRDGTRDG